MAEIWGAAIAVGGAVVSGIAAEKKAKNDRKNANEDRRAATKEEAQYGSVISRFDAEQEDYFNQLNRSRKQRGLDQFRQFSTMNQIAPNYTETNRIVVPNRPDVNAIINEVVPPETPQVKGKGKSTWEKIDPIGSKIIKGLF